ncbi:MAG: hypothetical protein NVSMB52_13390 [Chloroflexota bacterium]
MQRILSVAGSVLVLTGFALLTYVGITYATAVSPRVHVGSQLQKPRVNHSRASFQHSQRVAVPIQQAKQIPARVPAPATRIVIPKVKVDTRVVQTAAVGGVWIVADWAIGHLTSTPDPGVPGNGAYAAHDDIKGEIFKRIGELKQGDPVLVYTSNRVFRYAVTGQEVVDPSNVSVLNPTTAPTITLITCAPYWVDTQRLIIHAVLKSQARI